MALQDSASVCIIERKKTLGTKYSQLLSWILGCGICRLGGPFYIRSFYIRNLKIHGCLCPQGTLESNCPGYRGVIISSFKSLSRVWLFATPWTAAHQASLSISKSRSLYKLMSVESMTHPAISSSVICFSSCLQSFPASGSFPMSQFFTSGGQRIGVSASSSVLPMNIQKWFPLGLAGWISF